MSVRCQQATCLIGDLDRTVRDLHNSIGAATDQALVDFRMAGFADNSLRIPHDDMRMLSFGSVPASFGFSCDRSKLRDFPATAGRLSKLGLWQKVAREIERIGDHRWDHGARDYSCDKR
jgi:hypothetical protein